MSSGGDALVAISVSIFDENYTLHGRDPWAMKRLAEYVDTKMRELHGKIPDARYHKLAVLTALNIAAEVFQNREGQTGLEQTLGQLDETSQAILMLLSEEQGSPE